MENGNPGTLMEHNGMKKTMSMDKDMGGLLNGERVRSKNLKVSIKMIYEMVCGSITLMMG